MQYTEIKLVDSELREINTSKEREQWYTSDKTVILYYRQDDLEMR
jgi:hypothetical protein